MIKFSIDIHEETTPSWKNKNESLRLSQTWERNEKQASKDKYGLG